MMRAMRNNEFFVRDIIQRAAEFLIAEVVVSLVLATLAFEGVVSVSMNSIGAVGFGLLVYIVFVVWSSHEYLFMVRDKKQYFKVSYVAYGIVALISLILMIFESGIVTWLFFPMQLMMIFGLGSVPALIAMHVIVFAFISLVGMIINPTIPVNKPEDDEEIGYETEDVQLTDEELDEAFARYEADLSFRERRRQRKFRELMEQDESDEETDDEMGAYEEVLSFSERRRQRRIHRRRELIEAGEEPSILSFIAMRAMELLIPMLVGSFIMSILVTLGWIPSVVGAALCFMGLGLLAYIIYVGITSHQLFFAVMDVKKYLAINLGGYGVVIAVSAIARLIDIKIFSWMFLPTKVFTLLGLSAWVSLWISHLMVVIVMLVMLINARFIGFDEPEFNDEI